MAVLVYGGSGESAVVGHVLAVGGCLLVAVGVRECYVCCERFLSKRGRLEDLPIRKTQRALADICPPLNFDSRLLASHICAMILDPRHKASRND